MAADAVLNDGSTTTEKTVDQKQTKAGWQTTDIDLPFTVKAPGDKATKGYWTVKWDATNNKVVAE